MHDWSVFALGPTGWGDELLRGLGVTLALALVSWAIGTVLGVAGGLIEHGAPRALAAPLGILAALVRSLPELLVVFIVFYAGAWAIERAASVIGLELRVALPPFVAGIVALALVHAAYTSETIKGGLGAVPRGMHEAARALGLGRVAHARHVTLPLALRYALPGLANLWMVIVKNTPFVSAIGVQDLVGQAATAGQNTKRYFAFFLAVLLCYLAISAVSMRVQVLLERRAARHLADAPR